MKKPNIVKKSNNLALIGLFLLFFSFMAIAYGVMFMQLTLSQIELWGTIIFIVLVVAWYLLYMSFDMFSGLALPLSENEFNQLDKEQRDAFLDDYMVYLDWHYKKK